MNLATLPEHIKRPLRQLKWAITSVPYHGKGRYCPICSTTSRIFKSFGRVQRIDAQCPRCGALERHRLLWLFLQRKTNLFDGESKKMLHVAPEHCLEARLRQALGSNYLTADLQSTKATMQMDVTDIPFADAHFDVIYCSHVLEHVQDDLTAMTEFCRTLKPDGWAVLLVPITTEKTYEDPKITSAAERLKAYGHEEHVRRYGLDYVDRLRDAGFRVSTFTVADVANEREAMEMGLTSASGDIFFCTK